MGSKRKSDPDSHVVEEHVSLEEDAENKLSAEQESLLEDYLIFTNGAGHNVLNDLKETFYDMHSEPFNDELAEIPHPYREYTIKGTRLVIQKIMDTIKLAQRGQSDV